MISSTWPHSPSTTTASSMRMGWAVAIWMPANRFLRTGWSARPAMMPTTPAEASRDTPHWRTAPMVIRAMATLTMPIMMIAAR